MLTVQNFYICFPVADMYPDNPFHNFAHASHVVMAVLKHMGRIITPSEIGTRASDDDNERVDRKLAAALHDHTYGITSDPLTQFACVFSALIRKWFLVEIDSNSHVHCSRRCGSSWSAKR